MSRERARHSGAQFYLASCMCASMQVLGPGISSAGAGNFGIKALRTVLVNLRHVLGEAVDDSPLPQGYGIHSAQGLLNPSTPWRCA